MRRLAFVFALLLCCVPAYAIDWHLAMEAGVNEDENLESRVAFRVQRFYAGLEARQSDYAEASVSGGTLMRRGYPWNWTVSPTSVVYDTGLQWRASLHYRAFTNNGPTLAYTRLNNVDETYFVGWRAVFGNDQ